MTPAVVFAAVAVVLFVLAFVSKRRFGLLGLALAAGATISTIWSYDAGLVVSATGLLPEGPATQAIVQSLVVLLPAILLLFHGYSYKNGLARAVGSLMFAVLALAFLVEPLEYALPLSGAAAEAYSTIKQYKDAIISVGVILAVLDIFFTKPARAIKKSSRS